VPIASAAVAALLIVGGIAFAAQSADSDNTALGPERKVTPKKIDKTPLVSDKGTSTQPVVTVPGTVGTTTTRPPVTIVGPNGEMITVPAAVTPVNPGTQAQTPPPSPPGVTQSPVTEAPAPTPTPTIPEDSTTTTTRPIPNQDEPQLDVSGGSNPEDPVVSVDINASDSDGYIASVDITWEAGESPENIASYDGNACDDPPPSSHALNAQHTYATSGTHSVSVTVTTKSCDGTSQQASRSVSVTSGGTTDTTVSSELVTP